MHDVVFQVLSLLPRDSFTMRDLLMLCHTCKEMHSVITQNHGPIFVDVSLDVQQMQSLSMMKPFQYDTAECTYDLKFSTTRDIMSSLLHFDVKYKIHGLTLDFCNEGYQANLTSVVTSKRADRLSFHEYFIFNALQNMQYLNHIHFYNVNLNTDLVSHYVSTFRGTELSLVQCGLHMGCRFFDAIALVDNLVKLCLSGNRFIENEHIVSAFGTKLQVLNCSDCVSSDIRVLCGARVQNTLLVLHWNDNYIPDDHKTMLYTWLRTCPHLHTLHLRNTRLHTADATALVDTFVDMPKLSSLDVASNEFGHGVLAFVAIIPRMRQFAISALRDHHVHLGMAWGRSKGRLRTDRFRLYEELEIDDLDVDA